MSEPRYRLWIYRLAAPAAFFLAAIILVVLIQRGLNNDSPSATGSTTPTVTTPSDTTPTTTHSNQKKKVYRVKTGDTLESIAAKFNTTVDDLLALNPGVDPLALSPGQKIRVS